MWSDMERFESKITPRLHAAETELEKIVTRPNPTRPVGVGRPDPWTTLKWSGV